MWTVFRLLDLWGGRVGGGEGPGNSCVVEEGGGGWREARPAPIAATEYFLFRRGLRDSQGDFQGDFQGPGLSGGVDHPPSYSPIMSYTGRSSKALNDGCGLPTGLALHSRLGLITLPNLASTPLKAVKPVTER